MKDKPEITVQGLLDAGFTHQEDPQFNFEYDLSDKTDTDQEHDYKPALLWDHIMGQFCVTDGEIMFIYFNADSPSDAVAWANRITSFDLN